MVVEKHEYGKNDNSHHDKPPEHISQQEQRAGDGDKQYPADVHRGDLVGGMVNVVKDGVRAGVVYMAGKQKSRAGDFVRVKGRPVVEAQRILETVDGEQEAAVYALADIAQRVSGDDGHLVPCKRVFPNSKMVNRHADGVGHGAGASSGNEQKGKQYLFHCGWLRGKRRRNRFKFTDKQRFCPKVFKKSGPGR